MSDTLNDVLGNTKWEAVGSSSGGGDGDAVVLEIGEALVGTYNGASEHPSKFNKDRPSILHRFTKPDGTKTVMWGKGNLNYQMKEVREGQLVKIERLPDEETKQGFTVKTFLVFTAA